MAADREILEIFGSLDTGSAATRIPTMLKLAWIRGWIVVAGLSLTSLGGCAGIPVWPDRASAPARSGSSLPRTERREFDPKTACAQVIKAHNRLRAEARLPALA